MAQILGSEFCLLIFSAKINDVRIALIKVYAERPCRIDVASFSDENVGEASVTNPVVVCLTLNQVTRQNERVLAPVVTRIVGSARAHGAKTFRSVKRQGMCVSRPHFEIRAGGAVLARDL